MARFWNAEENHNRAISSSSPDPPAMSLSKGTRNSDLFFDRIYRINRIC